MLSLRGPLALQAGGPLDSEVVWSVILGHIPRASPKYYHDGLPLLCPPDGWSLPGGQLVAPQPRPPAKPLFLLLGEHREKCTGTTPSSTASSLPPLQANGLSLRRCKRRPAPGARGAPVGVACGWAWPAVGGAGAARAHATEGGVAAGLARSQRARRPCRFLRFAGRSAGARCPDVGRGTSPPNGSLQEGPASKVRDPPGSRHLGRARAPGPGRAGCSPGGQDLEGERPRGASRSGGGRGVREPPEPEQREEPCSRASSGPALEGRGRPRAAGYRPVDACARGAAALGPRGAGRGPPPPQAWQEGPRSCRKLARPGASGGPGHG